VINCFERAKWRRQRTGRDAPSGYRRDRTLEHVVAASALARF
jgi:hypothetical protein